MFFLPAHHCWWAFEFLEKLDVAELFSVYQSVKLGSTRVYAQVTGMDLANSVTRLLTLQVLVSGREAAEAAAGVTKGAVGRLNNALAKNTIDQSVAVATNGTFAITPGITYSGTTPFEAEIAPFEANQATKEAELKTLQYMNKKILVGLVGSGLLVVGISFLTVPSLAKTKDTRGDVRNETALTLGTISNVIPIANCPSGYACKRFTVTCPNILPLTGVFALGNATQAKGVSTFSTGQGGLDFYSDQGVDVARWMHMLRNNGLTIVQIKWDANWWATAGTNQSGIAQLACRPATIIQYIYETYYLPLGLGRKSFITTGNSGGASQVSYPLAYYGLDSIIDVSIPTGGPPHSALQKSCMNIPGEENYWFDNNNRTRVDNSYGITGGNSPCFVHNASLMPTWTADAVAYGGNDYFYPNTLVHQIIGANDPEMLTTASDYRDVLQSTHVWEVVPNTPHAVFSTIAGRQAISNVILQALAP